MRPKSRYELNAHIFTYDWDGATSYKAGLKTKRFNKRLMSKARRRTDKDIIEQEINMLTTDSKEFKDLSKARDNKKINQWEFEFMVSILNQSYNKTEKQQVIYDKIIPKLESK